MHTLCVCFLWSSCFWHAFSILLCYQVILYITFDQLMYAQFVCLSVVVFIFWICFQPRRFDDVIFVLSIIDSDFLLCFDFVTLWHFKLCILSLLFNAYCFDFIVLAMLLTGSRVLMILSFALFDLAALWFFNLLIDYFVVQHCFSSISFWCLCYILTTCIRTPLRTCMQLCGIVDSFREFYWFYIVVQKSHCCILLVL